VTHKGRGELDQTHGDTAVQHQLACENEERDRQQREDRDAGNRPLKGDQQRKTFVPERGQGCDTHCKGDGDTDHDGDTENAKKDCQTHD